MSFNKLIAQGVAIANSLTESLQANVTHEPWIDSGANGQPIFDSAVSRPAVVSYNRTLIRTTEGEQVMQSATGMFLDLIEAHGAEGRREPVDPRDRITLPDGYKGPIVNVRGPVDPDTNAPYFLEVALG